MHAATDGGWTTPAAVDRAASSAASTTGIEVAATIASAIIATARERSEAMISLRRSQRSASTPPIGPRTTSGATRAAVVAASQAADRVRS